MAGSASPHPLGSPSTWQVPFSLWPNLCFLPWIIWRTTKEQNFLFPGSYARQEWKATLTVWHKFQTHKLFTEIQWLDLGLMKTVMRLLIWRCLISSIAGWSRGSHFPNLLASLLCPCARHSPHRSRPRCIICTPGTNLLSFDVLKSFRAPCLKFVDNLSE